MCYSSVGIVVIRDVTTPLKLLRQSISGPPFHPFYLEVLAAFRSDRSISHPNPRKQYLILYSFVRYCVIHHLRRGGLHMVSKNMPCTNFTSHYRKSPCSHSHSDIFSAATFSNYSNEVSELKSLASADASGPSSVSSLNTASSIIFSLK